VLAHEAFEKALQINYQQGIATSYNNLGISYSIRGDYGTGLDYFIKALRLRESLQDLPAVSKTFNNIARVFHYQGDLEKAIAYSNRSLELHNQIDDSVDLAMAHISHGDIYLSMTDNASALIAVKKSREIFARKGSKNQEGWSLMATGALGFVIYRYYQGKKQSTRALEKLNREIYEKHEEILAQSEELTQANEEIKRINESLEAEVTLRAHKIEEQNKKLIDYAYFNAHNVRGPLARIMGLSMLMERESPAGQLKEYTTCLITAAHELDSVIKEINLNLE
jgi:tetratricopeptide (TPR) repeat protein